MKQGRVSTCLDYRHIIRLLVKYYQNGWQLFSPERYHRHRTGAVQYLEIHLFDQPCVVAKEPLAKLQRPLSFPPSINER